MSDSEILNRFQRDLTAAGFEPKKYFDIASELKKWGDCSICGESCYLCPNCGKVYHPQNLRQAEDGTWSCLRCLSRGEEIEFGE